MTLKHFTWVYYMIWCHVGPPWGHSGIHGGHVGLWKGPRVVQYDIISYIISMRSVLGPFAVMKGHFWSQRTIFGAILGHYGAPVGLWKGPRVVQHDIQSCYIAFRVIWSHAVTFWAILVILSHSRPFWCCFGSFWGPRGYLNGPRVVQHDI